MIRSMTQEEIPGLMRLKEAAGWNQTEQDWANVMRLEPEGCWVWEEKGTVAGSATAVCFGQDLAWIGMVLVLPEFRGRGIARALMEQGLGFLDRRGVRCVKLDATDMGRPLYVKLGFEDETAIERWGMTVPETFEPSGDSSDVLPLASVDPILSLDRKAFGVDRGALLRQFLKCFRDEAWTTGGSYLLARPGSNAHFLGPCVAEEQDAARRLIEVFLAGHRGDRVFWDLLPENTAAQALASEIGFERKRRLVRMLLSKGGCQSVNSSMRLGLQFATAGFEYG